MLWRKVFPLGLPFVSSARSCPPPQTVALLGLWFAERALRTALGRGGWGIVDVPLPIRIKDLKKWLPQIENIKIFFFSSFFFSPPVCCVEGKREAGQELSQSPVGRCGQARLPLPEAVNCSKKKSTGGKRSALNSPWSRFSVSRSSFADYLLKTAAQMEWDFYICSASIPVARWDGGSANKHGSEDPIQLC